MAVTKEALDDLAGAGKQRARWLQAVIDFSRQRPLGALGAALIVIMTAVALGAQWIAPYDVLKTDYGAMLAAPNAQHWLGTDAYGRDVFSRIVFGSQTALIVGLGASFIGATFGALIGVASAYFGGRVDMIVQRVMDVLISFPL
ncbi:MAG: D,D-dipeptide ABC transporter permease, partial [Burkholderiales bacterium]